MQFLDFSLIRMISECIVRKVFLVLDARWEVRWKDLTDYARETETLEGYRTVEPRFTKTKRRYTYEIFKLTV